jgi:SAM-dependent methyltransferase
MDSNQNDRRPEALPPVAQLFNIATGFMKSQAIYVAAKLGISDLLNKGPKSIEELAEMTSVQESALYRLLRALASIGIYIEKAENIFELTPMAAALQSDSPMSLRPYVLLLGDKSWWDAWGNLLYSVQTGEAAFNHIFGMNYSDYLEKDPALAQTFNKCMSSVSKAHEPAIVQSYDFSKYQKIVDIGGGHGSLLSAILQGNPQLKGIVFDLPHVVGSIKKTDFFPNDRVKIIGGDFFEKVPVGGDIYLLKQIIHDWDDTLSLKILKNCYEAMPPNGRILIIDTVIRPGQNQSTEKFFDLHMLVTASGGKERTEVDFRCLLESAGFEFRQIIPTPSSFGIVEGLKS